jgi:V/A-type H+-transporting ATPase subunit G/H
MNRACNSRPDYDKITSIMGGYANALLASHKVKEVRNMSLEAIQQVTAAEQAAREQKALALDEAKRIVAEAERAGKQLVADARAQAEEQVKALLAEAEARAGKRTEQALADSTAQCEALKQTARGRLDRAAGLIVGRVGNS